jgi:hypothetical protein
MTTINFIYLGGLTGHFSSPPLTPSPRTRQPQTHPQKSNFLSVRLAASLENASSGKLLYYKCTFLLH